MVVRLIRCLRVHARAVIFSLKDPDGYREPNRRLIEFANQHRQQLCALARIDPADDSAEQVRGCLDRGAVGIKLHPRGEGFAVADERLDDVFAIAHERRLPVIIHAGPGDPSIGLEALERARRTPGARLILAHCAIGSFEQVIHEIDDLPNIFFDTSWWNPADIWALFRMVTLPHPLRQRHSVHQSRLRRGHHWTVGAPGRPDGCSDTRGDGWAAPATGAPRGSA